MTEITSFNDLFAQAKLSSLRLSSFAQLDNGNFRANWRRGEKFFDCVEHPLPFLALLNAFVLADLGSAASSSPHPPAPASFEDVFG